jgi:hypothetical protein
MIRQYVVHIMSPSSYSATPAPTQTQFISHGLVSAQAPEATTCSICVQLCLKGEAVVKLVPCTNCYYHRECILAWFTSYSSQRGTCPNDRTVLFKPNPLSTSTPYPSNGTPGLTTSSIIESRLPSIHAAAAHQRVSDATVVQQLCESHLQDIATFARAQSEIDDRDSLITIWAGTEHIHCVRRHVQRLLYMHRRIVILPTHECARLARHIDDAHNVVGTCINRYRDAVREVIGQRRDAFRVRLDQSSSVWLRDLVENRMCALLDGSVTQEWWYLAADLREAEHLERMAGR